MTRNAIHGALIGSVFCCSCSLGTISNSTKDGDPDTLTSCLATGDAACTSEEYCTLAGQCVDRMADGSTSCERDGMCLSDNCVNGTCCLSGCDTCNGLTCLSGCGDGYVNEAAGEECENQPGCDPITCKPRQVEVIAVSDSANDGHLPEWTVDDNVDTESRWSANGPPDPWIQYDLSDVGRQREAPETPPWQSKICVY